MKKPTTPDLEPAEITMAEDGEMLTIKRNTRTMAAAKRLSDYVNSLELTAEQNNKLVELMIDQTHEAELGAFLAGANMAAAAITDGGGDEPEQKPPIKFLQ